jgi:peptidoglycan/LPS O-acetylase OafA/YrhL
VRAFALLLGVLFHAAESFGPDNYYWAIVDSSPSPLLENIRFACHSFRLELFFVIAGFFARLVIVRKGTGPFVSNRTKRIFVPFVLGWLVLYPILVLIWLWGRTISGNLGDLGIPPEAQGLPAWKLWIGFFVTLGFLKKFDLTHLWFLHQLLVLYAIFLGSARAVRRVKPLQAGMANVDRWFGSMTTSYFSVVAFAVFSVPLLLTMKSWVVDTPKESLIPQWPTTFFFGFCFAAGWLWQRAPAKIEVLANRWIPHLVIGILFWLSFAWFDFDAIRKMSADERWRAHLLFTILYAHMMWGFVLGFLGLFTRFFNQPSTWTRYVADSSYWIYIAHLPLVVALQVAVAKIPLIWQVKYPLIVGIATVILFLSYHYLVRGTWIGLLLNGRRHSLVWPWREVDNAASPPEN